MNKFKRTGLYYFQRVNLMLCTSYLNKAFIKKKISESESVSHF